jgi:PAS domain S-box-containing protein
MGQEITFRPDQFIVSKTDKRGIIQYVNQSFMDVSGFVESELIGKPHSVIRNEMMPRCIFKYFWDNIKQGKEFFAYVVNECKNGDYYWVLAYVTPDRDSQTGEISGYFSVRRVPSQHAIQQISAFYRTLCEEEAKHSSKVKGMEAGEKIFLTALDKLGMDYHALVYGLENGEISL